MKSLLTDTGETVRAHPFRVSGHRFAIIPGRKWAVAHFETGATVMKSEPFESKHHLMFRFKDTMQNPAIKDAILQFLRNKNIINTWSQRLSSTLKKQKG